MSQSKSADNGFLAICSIVGKQHATLTDVFVHSRYRTRVRTLCGVSANPVVLSIYLPVPFPFDRGHASACKSCLRLLRARDLGEK